MSWSHGGRFFVNKWLDPYYLSIVFDGDYCVGVTLLGEHNGALIPIYREIGTIYQWVPLLFGTIGKWVEGYRNQVEVNWAVKFHNIDLVTYVNPWTGNKESDKAGLEIKLRYINQVEMNWGVKFHKINIDLVTYWKMC